MHLAILLNTLWLPCGAVAAEGDEEDQVLVDMAHIQLKLKCRFEARAPHSTVSHGLERRAGVNK